MNNRIDPKSSGETMESEGLSKAGSPQLSHTFDVFLSYSRKDRDFAKRLEQALESYKFPKSLKLAKRNLNVFRDESDIQATEDYHRTINEHLKSSTKLIVVCSPDARKSRYVEDEIKRFIQTHGEQDIIPVLFRGKANNESTDEHEKAFPEVLCQDRMPLAANFLGSDVYKGKLHKGAFSNSFYSILASIQGVDRRKLEQIDEKLRTRKRAVSVSVAGGVIAVLSVALVFAVISQRKAVAATDAATKSAKAEEEAKNRALASAEAERKARDEAVASAAAEKKAKDEAVASAAAERKAKNEAVAAAKAEEIAKNEAIAQKKATEQLLYVADMKLAQRYHETHEMTRVHQFLNAHARATTPEQDDLRSFTWNYLWRNSYRELAMLEGHSGAIAFSPDGETFASSSSDQTVRLWNTKTLREVRTFDGRGAPVGAITFSPDGSKLAAASVYAVRLWNTATGEVLTTIQDYQDPGDPRLGLRAEFLIRSVVFSPDGNTLAYGNQYGPVKLWDTRQKKVVDTINTGALALAFSPDGSKLATSAAENTYVRVWDFGTHRELKVLKGHGHDVASLVFSPDGKTLATAGSDPTIRLWNLDSPGEAVVISGELPTNYSLAFSPDGRRLASASFHRRVKIWDTKTGMELAILKHAEPVHAVAFSPDGKTLASCCSNQQVKLWDVSPRQELDVLKHSETVYSFAYSPDGKTLATVQYGDKILMTFWDINTREKSVIEPDLPISHIEYSPNGKMFATIKSGGSVTFWDANTRKPVHILNLKASGFAFSPDGKTFAITSEKSLILHDTSTFAVVATLSVGQKTTSVTFSANGNLLAVITPDHKVRLWNTRTKRELPPLVGHTNDVTSIAFSPDSKLLASGGRDNTVRLWDLRTSKPVATLEEHTDFVETVAFSPDGKTLASGSGDKTVKVWDVSTRQELMTLKGHTDAIWHLAFSPAGSTLASSSSDKTVRLWIGARRDEVAAAQRRP